MIADPTTGEELAVFDVHHHVSMGEDVDGETPLATRLDAMDVHGIDVACLLPPTGAVDAVGAGMVEVNDHVSRLRRAAPERFPIAAAHVDLADGGAACEAEIVRCFTELDLRAVQFHHRFQGRYIDDAAMPGLLRRCAELRALVFIHVVEGSTLEAPWRLERLLGEVPDATVIALDAFSSFDRGGEIREIARRHENLYADLGGMSSVGGFMISAFVDAVGPDRLLLGTNLYTRGSRPISYRVAFPVLEVVHMDLPLEVRRAILHDNAARLLA